jgi:PIN domain nuclease of toxin-antitoxin system
MPGGNKVVLDASALLAVLRGEAGAEEVAGRFPDVVMSAVNVSEVLKVLADGGVPIAEAQGMMAELVPDVVPFTATRACATAALHSATKSKGLSLGDRACLSLADELHLTVLTADSAWANLPLDVRVQLIR